jgi:SAM-dependent methyltransferase
MEMVPDFDLWAELYSTWTRVAREDPAEIAYYRRLAAGVDGPIADLGIGVGRLAAEMKPDVGVDISAAMLEEARRRLGAGIELIQADLADFALPEPAALQYCGQNTFNHLHRERVPAALTCAFRNAAPGGRLAFEAVQPRPERQKAGNGLARLRAWADGQAIYEITRMLDKQGRDVEMIGLLERLDERHRVIERSYFPPIRFSFLTMAEVTGWAGAAGWEIETAHADFHGTPLAAESSTGVWCLRKPGGRA